MPRLMVSNPRGQEGAGQGGRGGQVWVCPWMEEVKEDEEGEPAGGSWEQQSSSHQTPWSQTLRTLRTLRLQGWSSFAAVGVVWSVCQVEAPLHPSLMLVDVCWRLLLVCLLWMVLGGCVHALKCCLQPGQNQCFRGEPPPRIQQDVITENRNNHCLWTPQSRGPVHEGPLALALADGLLQCVLQEPLPDPSVAHIKALLSRLGSVCHTLEKADVGSEDQDSILAEKVKLILTYLQQRMSSLGRLVQVQGDFEASVKDMLEGLDDLWAQLEELHTGVTLTKEGSQGHVDLASAQTDTETLFAVLGHYRNRLQCSEAHLRDSTRLLQELTWNHAHIRIRASRHSESVWPELLLQSNIEQFDKVQEGFRSVEQQISAFQAHLEGLGKEDQDQDHSRTSSHTNSKRRTNNIWHRDSISSSTSVEGLGKEDQEGPLADPDGAHSGSVSPLTSSHPNSKRRTNNIWHRDSISSSTSVEGLGKEDQDQDHSGSVSPQSSSHPNSKRRTNNIWHRDSISTSTSVSSMDADSDSDGPVSLCERSAHQFTSTIGRLRKSGKRK